MSYLALLGPYRVPLALLDDAAGNAEKQPSTVMRTGQFKSVIRVLRRYSLLIDDEDGNFSDAAMTCECIRLHGLVRSAAIALSDKARRDLAQHDLIEMLSAFIRNPVMVAIGDDFEYNVGHPIYADGETIGRLPTKSVAPSADPSDLALANRVGDIIEHIYSAPEWQSKRSEIQRTLVGWLMQIKWGPMLHRHD